MLDPFVEFTNCNLSRKFVELVLIFINHVEEPEISHNCAKSYLKNWARFLSTFTRAVSEKGDHHAWLTAPLQLV